MRVTRALSRGYRAYWACRRRSARLREGFNVAFGLDRRLSITPQAINSPQAIHFAAGAITPQAIHLAAGY